MLFEDIMKPDQLENLGASVVNFCDARLLMEQMFYLSGEFRALCLTSMACVGK